MEKRKKTLAIVIPVFSERDNLFRLYDRLESVTNSLPEYSWLFIFVNDGSTDDSYQVLQEIAASDDRVLVLDLSRNFGKEIALTAGVHEAEGGAEAVICIDADLQHPPEVIPTLIERWREGAEVVVTQRLTIEQQPWPRRVGSWLYYWLMGRISGLDILPQTTDFRLYDAKVVAAFKHATERERMFRGIMDWMGFRRAVVTFHADARRNGEAGYSYRKLIKLAVNSITAFSLWPLRLTGYLGVLITLGSSLLLLWMLANYLMDSHLVYTPLAMVVVANTFLIGIVLMAIGLVALYIGNIHTEVINRPLYIVRERIGNQQSPALPSPAMPHAPRCPTTNEQPFSR